MILGLIDLRVRATPLPRKAQLEMTAQQQAIALRQQVDRQRELRCAAELELIKMALQPHRDRHLLEYERRRREEQRQQAEGAMKAVAADMQQQMKDMRRAHAAELTQLRRDERAARVAIEEQLLRVQAENTELARQLRAARSAARQARGEAATVEQEAAVIREAAEAEVARVRDHGRAWAKVREAEAHAASTKASRDEVRQRVAELEGQLSSRSRARAAEYAELLTLRGRVKELREKVESYQARSTRRFFELDPIAEENQRLRQQLVQQ